MLTPLQERLYKMIGKEGCRRLLIVLEDELIKAINANTNGAMQKEVEALVVRLHDLEVYVELSA